MTRVFISWSGQKSHDIASELREWLPNVLQFAKPYFSPSDIEKGTKWNSEVSQTLSECDVGLLCLTAENLTKPWIIFEAGALSKNFDNSHVTAILCGIEASDVKGPLSSFQNTKFEKADFKRLVDMVNSSGGESSLDATTLSRVFDKWWPDLHNVVSAIMNRPQETAEVELRTERDLLEEVLELTRAISRTAKNQNNQEWVWETLMSERNSRSNTRNRIMDILTKPSNDDDGPVE